MKRIIASLILILIMSYQSEAGFDQNGSLDSAEVRSLSAYLAAGYPELGVLGVQYQLSDRFGIGIKFNEVAIKGDPFIFMFPASAPGVGVKASYYFQPIRFFPFNVLNVDISFLFRNKESWQGDHSGGAGEISFGYDAIQGHGVGVLFALGGALTAYNHHEPLWALNVKLGIHLNV